MLFKDCLKSLRRSAGVTLTDLAIQTRINRVTLSRLEHGRTQPSLNMARRLAEAFGVSLATFDDVEIIPEKNDQSV